MTTNAFSLRTTPTQFGYRFDIVTPEQEGMNLPMFPVVEVEVVTPGAFASPRVTQARGASFTATTPEELEAMARAMLQAADFLRKALA